MKTSKRIILCRACIAPVIHFGVQYKCLLCLKIGAILPSWAEIPDRTQGDGIDRAGDFRKAVASLSHL